MSLAGPFAIGQTLRLGNHTGSDRTAITDANGVATTPTSATLTVTKRDSTGLPIQTTYTYPGTLQEETSGRLYVDVLPAAGEAGRWSCSLKAVVPTVADNWEFVVEFDPT